MNAISFWKSFTQGINEAKSLGLKILMQMHIDNEGIQNYNSHLVHKWLFCKCKESFIFQKHVMLATFFRHNSIISIRTGKKFFFLCWSNGECTILKKKIKNKI